MAAMFISNFTSQRIPSELLIALGTVCFFLATWIQISKFCGVFLNSTPPIVGRTQIMPAKKPVAEVQNETKIQRREVSSKYLMPDECENTTAKIESAPPIQHTLKLPALRYVQGGR